MRHGRGAGRGTPAYVDVPIAADESIRRAADPYRVRDLEAADIAVLKVQPLGGVRACLRIAEDIGLPMVVSSALETSVGLAAGVALAAALPELEYACGPRDRAACWPTTWPTHRLAPVDGYVPVRRPDGLRGAPRPLRGEPRAGGALAGPAGRGTRRGPGSVLVTLHRAGPGRRPALRRGRGPRGRASRPARATPRWRSRRTTPRPPACVRLHTRIDERSAGFLALGLTKVGSQAAVICTSGTAVANLHPAMLEAAHAGVRLVAVTADRPARLRGTGANQTTDQVGIFGPLVPYVDLGPGDAAVARTALGLGDGPLHLNVQLDDPLVPRDRWTSPPRWSRKAR